MKVSADLPEVIKAIDDAAGPVDPRRVHLDAVLEMIRNGTISDDEAAELNAAILKRGAEGLRKACADVGTAFAGLREAFSGKAGKGE